VLKQTPLNAVHRALNARLVDFGGWEMPLHYGSQIEEHHRVRKDAGMFDVSHMLALNVDGEGAQTFLRQLLANNVDRLMIPGKALYSCMLNDSGGILDDLIVYFLDPRHFRVVVNAATADKDLAWMFSQRARTAAAVTVTPRRDLAMIAVQGPAARAKVWRALPLSKPATGALGPFFAAEWGAFFFGRTGAMFAFEHWGLEPDLVPVAKSLSGGYVPVGALLMSRAVHEAVFDSMENAFSHGSTFAPNELAMAAGLATLHELDEEGLVERSARLGAKLLELTQPLVDEFEVVHDVRGLGLMWAIEFGEPEKAGRRSWRMIERMQPGLFAQLVVAPLFAKHKILSQVAGHRMAVLKALPPLVVSDEDVDYFVDALSATIKRAQRMPSSLTRFALTAAGIG